MLPHADLKQINFYQEVRPDKAKNLKYRYLSPGLALQMIIWAGGAALLIY